MQAQNAFFLLFFGCLGVLLFYAVYRLYISTAKRTVCCFATGVMGLNYIVFRILTIVLSLNHSRLPAMQKHQHKFRVGHF